jgi:hypothetical protein
MRLCASVGIFILTCCQCGLIVSTQTPARQIQFALKVIRSSTAGLKRYFSTASPFAALQRNVPLFAQLLAGFARDN